MRLIDHLKSLGHSNRAAQKLMQTGKVLHQGIPTADAARQVEPREVTVDPRAPRVRPGRDPAVIWHDRHLAIVWKPPGLLSVAAPRRRDDNLVTLMARRFGAAHPVHRLDELTSGVMMVALDKETQHDLKEMLARHDIERRYLAIVQGRPRRPSFTISNHLVTDRGDGLRGSGSGPGAKSATTHFRLAEALGERHTLMEARLESGRTHQVRIHLSESGLPVLGDPLYVSSGIAQAAPRLMLHAWRLGLVHPRTNLMLQFEAPLPDDMSQLRRRLISGDDGPAPQGRRGRRGRGSRSR